MNKEFTYEYPLLGRKHEQKLLKEFLAKNESELISVIGRRRVGKTFLVKRVYEKELLFAMTGIKDASKSKQLSNFTRAMSAAFTLSFEMIRPKNWEDAFEILKEHILQNRTKKKKVIFFDEFPWLASPRSGFIQAFDHFWNTWAVDQNLIVVICGSAATWMIKNIINNKGGLHNRVTAKINLEPFTLAETEAYFKGRKIALPRYDIITLYMALGGIPFYLRNIKRGESAIQAIDRICFGRSAILKNEFNNLYQSLFSNYSDHVQVVKVLATKRKGLTRKEILNQTKLKSGGAFSLVLRELEESSFISAYTPLQKKERDILYRLTDEYTLFYLQFIDGQKAHKGTWLKKALSPSIRSWSGYTFESICFKHIESIKIELGIEGIYSETSSYIHRKNDGIPGFQIDMLIDRADNVINLCETKFYNTEYILTSEEAKKIRIRKAYFEAATKLKKQIVVVLITTYGLVGGQQPEGPDTILSMDSLFN